jgi:hypothetical protein
MSPDPSAKSVGEGVAFLRSSMKSTAVSQQQSRLRCGGGECGQVSVELKLHNLAFPRSPIVTNMAKTKDNVPLYAGGHNLLRNGRMINLIPHIGWCLCLLATREL